MGDPHIDCARYIWLTGIVVAATALAIYVGTHR
jgi:hypothetical protein